MDDLRALHAEEDHTSLMNRMKTIDVSGIFKEYNTRVLIASFMLYKFRGEYNIDDELFELSKIIADAMVALDFTTISNNYNKYFDKFIAWRDGDIEQMRQELRSQVQACRHTMTPPRDIADRTWNECMENSIHLMNNSEQKLEKMSKTPPKR